MSLKDDLIAARALIDTPEKWCKWHGHMTRRKWLFFEQHSYCTIGAIAVEPGGHMNTSRSAYYKMRDALERALPPGFRNSFLVSFNDDESTTHNDVLALFDRAIEAAS
jgi:hypothetical protein